MCRILSHAKRVVNVFRILAYKILHESETRLLSLPSTRSKSSKMKAAPRENGSSFEHISGQGTTESSPTLTNSSMESVQNAVFESPQSLESPFQTGFDTPQSSVVNLWVRQALQQARMARFVECACVSGGPCVGTGGQATCGCGSSPEVVAKAKKWTMKRFTKVITKGLKRAWKEGIQAIKDGARRRQRKGPGAEGRVGGDE
jgi:hypothetical protein